MHYNRWQSHGDPETRRNWAGNLPGPQRGASNPRWVGAAAGYVGVHMRLRRRGVARLNLCHGCGEARAENWAYDHSCPDEMTGKSRGRDVPYSTDLSRYMPLCLSCHSLVDAR